MNLLNIELRNYLSYKSENISFVNKEGLYLIIGRNSETVDETEGNGSGKTGLISAVPFAFYGRSRGMFDKDLVNEDVIYKDEDDQRAKKAVAGVIFEHNGPIYKVVRSVTNKGVQAVTLHSATEYPTETWVDLTLKAGVNKRTGKRESGISRTEQRIVDILGCNLELFINSVFFEQSNIDTFATGTLNDKDNVIRTAIGLNRWLDYGKEMGVDLREVEKKILKIQALLDDYDDADDLREKIEKIKVAVVETNSQINESDSIIESKKSDVEELVKRLAIAEEKQKNIDKILADKFFLERKKKRIEENIDELDRKISKMEKQISEFNELKDDSIKKKDRLNIRKEQYDRETGDGTDSDMREYVSTINDISSNIGRVIAEIGAIDTQIEKVERAECPLGLECKELTLDSKKAITDDLLQKKKKQNFIKRQLETRKVNGHAKVNELQKILDAQKNLVGVIKELDSLNVIFDSYDERLTSCREEIKSCEACQEDLTVDYAQIADEELSKIVLDVETNSEDLIRSIRSTLHSTRTQLSTAEKTLCGLKDNQSHFENLEKKYEASIDKSKELRVDFSKLQDERLVVSEAQAIVRKEIPHLLIGNAIPEIKSYARKFIYKLSNGRLDIDFRLDRELKSKDDKTNAFDIFVNVRGKWLKYQQTSGGERARADVAIHLAYICFMCNMNKTKFETIFLDEVGAALDKNGVERFVEIIKEFLVEYNFKKIFNITQNIEMKKMIDNRLLVTMTDEGSKVTVG